MVCNSEECVVKCEFCGKILKPPERCSGCGQVTADLVERGKLEEYILLHRERVIPVHFTGDEWVVVRIHRGATPLPRYKHLLYMADRRVEEVIIEGAIDKIQIYNLFYPDTIPQILSTHRRDGKTHHYLVTQPLHLTIQGIANRYNTTMIELLTAFIDFVAGGENNEI